MQDDNFNKPGDELPPEASADVADAARGIGLRKVHAWVEDKSPKKRSVGAERTKRSREKAERLGKKQVSITVPNELITPIKTMFERINMGEDRDAAVDAFAREVRQKPDQKNEKPMSAKLRGWWGWLIRRANTLNGPMSARSEDRIY